MSVAYRSRQVGDMRNADKSLISNFKERRDSMGHGRERILKWA
jgi:hypothetical protein